MAKKTTTKTTTTKTTTASKKAPVAKKAIKIKEPKWVPVDGLPTVETADLDVPKDAEGADAYRFAVAIDGVTITYEVERDRRALIRGLKGLVAAVKAAA